MPRKPTGRPPGRPRSGAAEGRAWCRSIVNRPAVRKMLEEAAERDPAVALKLFEHGFGRPPQALEINSGPLKIEVVHSQEPIRGITFEQTASDELQ